MGNITDSDGSGNMTDSEAINFNYESHVQDLEYIFQLYGHNFYIWSFCIISYNTSTN